MSIMGDTIEEWEGHRWYPAIKEADESLRHIAPDYTITQIKSKFGGLRFYFDIPQGERTEEELALVRHIGLCITDHAEMRAKNIDDRIKAVMMDDATAWERAEAEVERQDRERERRAEAAAARALNA